MQFLDRIDAIERRSNAVNVSLWHLCRSARVDYACISRWRNGRSSPNVRTLTRYVEALEGQLEAIEEKLRKHLAAREERPAA